MQRAFLALSILALVAGACGGGGGGGGGGPTAPPPPAPPKVVTIEVMDNHYNPRSVVIEAGDTVRWVMRGTAPGHTVSERNGVWNSGFVFNNAGDAFERVFTAADNGRTYEYSCVTHQGCCQMQGSVRVGTQAPPPSPGY